MKNKNYIPVQGFGGQKIIGYWNENKNKFIPVSDIILDAFIAYSWTSYPITPFIIQISKEKINNVYHTYRTFNMNDERRIININ